MEPRRPDPDALLAQLTTAEPTRKRGWLKIFLGAVAGVGKTYAMLEQARERKRSGVDVVVGVVETHGRKETEALLEGLELLPRRSVEHRGVQLTEFDLDAALQRKPRLIIVDELAHTNAPGSRHAKRWLDVEELLASGIDVYTTMNVQHLESLNDVVARITHVKVRETVPDAVFEAADEVELVDLPPEELLKRLAEGKVYMPQLAQRALENFFKKGNLIALRQLALRAVAERVDAQMQVYRRAHAVSETWPIAERIVVGVGPALSSQHLVRATKRMADRLRAEWIAVFVETPEYAHYSAVDRGRVWETLRLAEQLGGRTATPAGRSTAELLEYARAQNATKIVVGKPKHSRWHDRLFGSRIDEIVRDSGDIDVYVISGEPEAGSPARRKAARTTTKPVDYLWATLAVAVVTAIAVFVRPRVELANIIMLYLLLVIIVASRAERRAAIYVSVLSVAAFDFFCVEPYLTFAVTDTRYIPVFAVMLLVALVISTLTTRLREQAESSRQSERRTAALYGMTRDLARSLDLAQALQGSARSVGEVFESDVVVLLPDPFGMLRASAMFGTAGAVEDPVARWVFDHGKPAGLGTDTLPTATFRYLPLIASGMVVGVLGIRPRDPARLNDPEQLHLLETLANQVATVIERANTVAEARRADQALEMSRLRSEFISTASHELRTPLSGLALNMDLLEKRIGPGLEGRDRELLDATRASVERLRALADDLLDLAKLEAGRMEMRIEPVSVPELIDPPVESLMTMAEQKSIRLISDTHDGLPPVSADPGRIYTVVCNLVTNAIEHTQSGGQILVTADAVDGFVQFSVADSGAGIPPEEQGRLFERFARVSTDEGRGTGLGLAIARQIVLAHGGLIWVDSGPGPGSVFSFTLPVTE